MHKVLRNYQSVFFIKLHLTAINKTTAVVIPNKQAQVAIASSIAMPLISSKFSKKKPKK
jgi:hypothetical protein